MMARDSQIQPTRGGNAFYGGRQGTGKNAAQGEFGHEKRTGDARPFLFSLFGAVNAIWL